MEKFLKAIFAIGISIVLSGCGGGGSSLTNNTDTTTATNQDLKAYYVDDPIVNVHFECGKYSGETDSNGKFNFEEGKGCKLSIGNLKIREIPASMLQDGIVIFESNPEIATFLQSLDSAGDNKRIVINSDVIKTLNSIGITQIPTSYDELKDIVEDINKKLSSRGISLKPKTKREAIAHLKESYQSYKDKKHKLTDDAPWLSSGIKSATPALAPAEIDSRVSQLFGVDNTQDKISQDDMRALVGNWAGEANHIRVILQLRRDGTYRYHSQLGIGRYHNYYRETSYEGNWHLANGNSQIVLELPDVDAPLILTNKFPKIETPIGVELTAGSDVDTTYQMSIDQSQNVVSARFTQKAQQYMRRTVADFKVPYFTMVAPKVNSETFWSSVGIRPAGYNYGHKLGLGSDDWNYALNRIKNDPTNYVFVISDENWQTLIGNRHNYITDIQNPAKVYIWLEYFKDQMQLLGRVPGTVLYIIAGDAPPFWAGDIRANHQNDPKKISGKIIESRFPEVLERNPSNSWAGIFQMMDYLRMKYAPNVKIGYTLKTWGIAERDIYNEPSGGWDSKDTVRVMAEYLNNYGVQFDFLSFNYHPRSSHSVSGYESAAKYFGAISKQLRTRDGSSPKLWIWKVSLWNREQPKFLFSHIDFLVNECNAIGMTLGHGNDLTGNSGFEDDPDKGIYIKSWMIEYFQNRTLNIPVHATKGLVNWK